MPEMHAREKDNTQLEAESLPVTTRRSEEGNMQRKVMGLAAFVLFYSLSVIPFAAQEKASKAGVVSGNVGLVDLEKKYMIVITKGGKLISFDFSGETKVTDASGKAKV